MDSRYRSRRSSSANSGAQPALAPILLHPQTETAKEIQPAESRAFATVEFCVLLLGFAVAGSIMSDVKDWHTASNNALVLGLVVYLALGLSFSGPIMVSWRERLGRRRPVWGIGESLWFATGLLVQVASLSVLLCRWFGEAWGAFGFFAQLVLLPFIYLTGNPRIEWTRAPLSWSNMVGALSVVLWGLCVVTAAVFAQ